ncbi:NAD-dependent epimerase/dehydratase family protein [Aneurinibacillus migulanus]|uniref:NAD-dependent epimerase/dehydratase family protein n=1 Tax=Aneurinibacillus migulanus TaxID=47500 RepID=UPI00209EF3E5|nr:NAD-dependent epimerase/dehydratase family protein [Aneurinibacillus migulanus]MCP1357536.1 NAD-dependent epimerase/dehydratase family protein [Aneurinibacillus migulanus]
MEKGAKIYVVAGHRGLVGSALCRRLVKAGYTTGYKGEITLNLEKPGGTLRKLLDISRLSELGWSDSISLWSGIAATNDWYKENKI